MNNISKTQIKSLKHIRKAIDNKVKVESTNSISIDEVFGKFNKKNKHFIDEELKKVVKRELLKKFQ